MANGFNGIIAQLEQQKAAIDKALAALRDVDGIAPAKAAAAPATRKGGMTPEGKERLVAALKKRWAAKKRAAKKAAAPVEVIPAASSPESSVNKRSEGQRKRWAAKNASGRELPPKAAEAAPVTGKGGMTEEGRKRLAEAMKKRWAVKRAFSAVKKAGRPKKAA
jgi:hypothetical protein